MSDSYYWLEEHERRLATGGGTIEGKVVEVGTGKLLKSGERGKFQVKKGDRVIFSPYAGTEVKVEGDEYLLINEDEILAVIEG